MLIPFDQLFRRHNISGVRDALHVGANTGQEAEMYDSLGIQRVVWVEAHEPTFTGLKVHIERNRHWRCTNLPLLACVADEDGKEVTFNVANNEAQSSSILEFGTHSAAHPSVKFVSNVKMKTRRLDTLMKACGLVFYEGSLLNIDLQGAELLALKGMGDLLARFDHLYLEVNREELYKGCALVGELDCWLASEGFEGIETKWTGAGWGDKYYHRI